MNSALKLIITLFLVCGIAAGSLAFVNKATQDPIKENARIARVEAQKKVLPGADEYVETQSYEKWTADRLDEKAGSVFEWKAMKGGEQVGSIFQTSVVGYSGIIKVIFGVDGARAITGVSVLSHTETPGLGAKITTPEFLSQYLGKTVGQVALKKDDPNGQIDAITAATISPRAVTKAIREAMQAGASSAAAAGGGN